MSEIKTKHRGGDKATKPGVMKGSHPEQKPGMAGEGVKLADMSWKGKK